MGNFKPSQGAKVSIFQDSSAINNIFNINSQGNQKNNYNFNKSELESHLSTNADMNLDDLD